MERKSSTSGEKMSLDNLTEEELKKRLAGREKQLADIASMMVETDQKIQSQKKDNARLEEQVDYYKNRLSQQEEKLKDILTEKELMFSKLQTALKEVKKAPSAAKPKKKSRGFFGNLLALIPSGGKKDVEIENNFIQTSKGFIKKSNMPENSGESDREKAQKSAPYKHKKLQLNLTGSKKKLDEEDEDEGESSMKLPSLVNQNFSKDTDGDGEDDEDYDPEERERDEQEIFESIQKKLKLLELSDDDDDDDSDDADSNQGEEAQ